jgi:hypothetical protein
LFPEFSFNITPLSAHVRLAIFTSSIFATLLLHSIKNTYSFPNDTMSHALILGASGISGWALLNQITKYPNSTTFSRITGLSNRPLALEQAQIPADPRLNLVNGIDLTRSLSEVAQLLKEKVEDAQSISHVFFTGMIDFIAVETVLTS